MKKEEKSVVMGVIFLLLLVWILSLFLLKKECTKSEMELYHSDKGMVDTVDSTVVISNPNSDYIITE
jgi:hypothetical protein